MEYMEIMIRDIYMKTGGKGDGIKKRFLALQCLLFFGLRRVSDVNKIRGRGVEFEEDGGWDSNAVDAYIWSVEEGMEVSKALVKSFVYRQNT